MPLFGVKLAMPCHWWNDSLAENEYLYLEKACWQEFYTFVRDSELKGTEDIV